MPFIANVHAAPRAFFVAGSDRNRRMAVLAGPYTSAMEADARVAETRVRAERSGLLARFRALVLAEGPEDQPTFLGRV